MSHSDVSHEEVCDAKRRTAPWNMVVKVQRLANSTKVLGDVKRDARKNFEFYTDFLRK